jgi:hypothetical protein
VQCPGLELQLGVEVGSACNTHIASGVSRHTSVFANTKLAWHTPWWVLSALEWLVGKRRAHQEGMVEDATWAAQLVMFQASLTPTRIRAEEAVVAG